MFKLNKETILFIIIVSIILLSFVIGYYMGIISSECIPCTIERAVGIKNKYDLINITLKK